MESSNRVNEMKNDEIQGKETEIKIFLFARK